MGKNMESIHHEKGLEKLSCWGRNINILGALAIGAAAMAIPGPNVVLSSWAGLNAVQAGGFEWARNKAKKRKKKNTASGKAKPKYG